MDEGMKRKELKSEKIESGDRNLNLCFDFWKGVMQFFFLCEFFDGKKIQKKKMKGMSQLSSKGGVSITGELKLGKIEYALKQP